MSTPEGLCTKCSATQYCAEHAPQSGETTPTPDLPPEDKGPHITAVEYARAQIVPLYRHGEEGTPYERGMIRQVAQHWLAGYFARQEAEAQQAVPDLGRLIERARQRVLEWKLLQSDPGSSDDAPLISELVEALAALQAQETKGERVFQAVVYAFEGKPVPEDLADHGMVRRGRKHYESAVESIRQEKAQLEDNRNAWALLATQAQAAKEQAEQTVLALQAECERLKKKVEPT